MVEHVDAAISRRVRRGLAMLMVLAVVACGPGAQSTSQSSTPAAPTGVATAQATIQTPTAATTTAPSPGAARGCIDYLTPAEITTATGRTGGQGTKGQPMTAGEVVCAYAMDGGSLTLSIYREPNVQAFYDGTVSALRNTVKVTGLGRAATYGDGPVPVKDAIAVLGEGVTFTLYNLSAVALGQDALRKLAALVLARL